MFLRLFGSVLVLAAGLAAAVAFAGSGTGRAADTTETSISTVTETTTEPTTVTTANTTTVEQTVTRKIITGTTPTATTSNESSGTPTWVWVLIAVGAAGLLGVLIWALASRKSGLAPEERRRLLTGAVGSWVGQGYAVENQTESSAILRRGNQRVVISVDANGQVSSTPLDAGPPDR